MVGKVARGKSFRGLATYLVRNRERVVWTDTRWLGAAEAKEVAREMRTAAQLSSRCEKPVYHVSLSFDSEDVPTRVQMEVACDAVLRDLGLEEHQAFLVAHNDTTHPHVHMMINRVHPETGRAWSTSHDYRRIERTLRGLEAEWDLRRVPGHHALEPDHERPDRSRSPGTQALRRARRTGERPFALEVRDRVGVGVDLARARSWQEFAQALKASGLRLETRRRGMVITNGRRYAPASRINRLTGRYQLEEHYGQTLAAYLSGRPQGRLVPRRQAHLSRSIVQGRVRRAHRMAGYRMVSGALHTLEHFMRGADEERRDDARQVRMFLRLVFILLPNGRELRRMYVSVKAVQVARRRRQELHALWSRHAYTPERVMRDRQARLSLETHSLDRSLVQVYRDLVKARRALDGMADREGVEAAAETLAGQPWRLGSVLEEERKAWLGLGVRPDRSRAYAAAKLSRRAVRSYLEARLRVPGPEELARMETEARARAERIAHLEDRLGRLPDEEALLRRTAERASGLSAGKDEAAHAGAGLGGFFWAEAGGQTAVGARSGPGAVGRRTRRCRGFGEGRRRSGRANRLQTGNHATKAAIAAPQELQLGLNWPAEAGFRCYAGLPGICLKRSGSPEPARC